MKRLIALLLAIAMVFAFAGCQSETQSESRGKKAAEGTEGSGEATQEVTEAPESVQQVSLADALSNSAEKMEAGNLTATLDGYVELLHEQTPGLASGARVPLGGTFQIAVDQENKDITVYGELSCVVVMNMILYDGWMVSYDSNVEDYYKEDISEELEGLFEEGEEFESLDEILDQIPEETLKEMEEIFDLEKMVELAETLFTEKFSDEQWLKDTFGYTSTTEGNVTVHTFELDLIVLLEEVFGHFEEAFVDEDLYLDLMDELDDMADEMPEFDLKLSLIQTDDELTGVGIYLEAEDPEAEMNVKVDATVTFSQVGTTQIDTEMLENILDEVLEFDEFFEKYYGEDGETEGDTYGSFMPDLL